MGPWPRSLLWRAGHSHQPRPAPLSSSLLLQCARARVVSSIARRAVRSLADAPTRRARALSARQGGRPQVHTAVDAGPQLRPRSTAKRSSGGDLVMVGV